MPGAPDESSRLNEEDLAARFARLAGTGPIALAVSGGSDSAALMHVAAHWRTRHPQPAPPLTVLTVDHQLRAASAGEAEQVAEEARALGLKHETLVWRGNKPKAGMAARAREARYDLMIRWCEDNGAERLCVAHTLDDQAETLIMRLARGSGVDGLSAMAPETTPGAVVLARPFLDVSRAQLRAYLTELGRTWIDDPTNEDGNFERVRVREALEVLGGLGVSPHQIATSANRLQRARKALDHMTVEAMKRHVAAHPAGFCTLAADLLIGEPDDIVVRVLNRTLMAVGGLTYPPRQSAAEDLVERLRQGGAQVHTLAGCRVALKGQSMEIAREPGRMPRDPMSLAGGQKVLWDGRFQVSYSTRDGDLCAQEAISVRPLRRDGWDMVKQHDQTISRNLREGFVSFWREDELLAVPHLGYVGANVDPTASFSAEFCNYSLLEGARKLPAFERP